MKCLISVNSSISKLITGCWIATHLKAGNPQQFPLMHMRGGYFLGSKYSTFTHAQGWFYTGIHLCPALVWIHSFDQIKYFIVYIMLSVHGYAFKSASKCIFVVVTHLWTIVKVGIICHLFSTRDRWQPKMLLTIEEHGSKIARNSVFDCHLSPVGRQMAIKNSVSNDFLSTLSVVLMFLIAAYPLFSH